MRPARSTTSGISGRPSSASIPGSTGPSSWRTGRGRAPISAFCTSCIRISSTRRRSIWNRTRPHASTNSSDTRWEKPSTGRRAFANGARSSRTTASSICSGIRTVIASRSTTATTRNISSMPPASCIGSRRRRGRPRPRSGS